MRILQHFGSVDEAAARAGLEGWPLRASRPLLDREAIVRALRARQRQGRAEGGAHLERSDWKAFGSWRQAMIAAELRHRLPPDPMPREQVIEALRERHRRGLPLHSSVVRTDDPKFFGPACPDVIGWPGPSLRRVLAFPARVFAILLRRGQELALFPHKVSARTKTCPATGQFSCVFVGPVTDR